MPVADTDIADAVIERPHAFKVGGKTYFLYPPSLGVMMLQRQCMAQLVFDPHADITLQALLNIHEHRDICALAVAYATCRSKSDVFDANFEERVNALSKVDDEGLATLLIWVITSFTTADKLRAQLGLDKEQERMTEVMRRKDKGSDMSFGGKSVFGTVIDPACERYGWTYEYAVWDISYTCLQMMLVDKISTLFMSEDEKKRIPARYLGDGEVINADDPQAYENIIKNMNWG